MLTGVGCDRSFFIDGLRNGFRVYFCVAAGVSGFHEVGIIIEPDLFFHPQGLFYVYVCQFGIIIVRHHLHLVSRRR